MRDQDWEDEDQNEAHPEGLALLSDLMGSGSMFDKDDVLENPTDAELNNDPVSQIDLQVSVHCASGSGRANLNRCMPFFSLFAMCCNACRRTL